MKLPSKLLIAIGFLAMRGPIFACTDSPGPLTISVTGAQAGSTPNYYIVQIPDTGGSPVTVTLTGKGDTPCPTEAEKCKCKDQSRNPDTDKDPKYTFTKTVGDQDPPDGPTITWKVDSSVKPDEYKFKLTKVEQKYKNCDQGWTGGVTSKENSQASDEITICAVKVSIDGSSMAVESQDSTDFKVKVEPDAAAPSAYKWLAAAPDAWPSGAGNSPELNYSAATADTTKVIKTRWFAPTNSRKAADDGNTAIYVVNCEVTVSGVKLKSLTPGLLGVQVDMSGQTSRAQFANGNSIIITHIPATSGTSESWKVGGQGGFTRQGAVAHVSPPATSQFYNKAMTHENKHVHQWASEAPWKDLYNANDLYINTISKLTSTVSEADLRSQIQAAITAQKTLDDAESDKTTCDREKAAYAEENSVEPHFLEMDEADWKPLYGCP